MLEKNRIHSLLPALKSPFTWFSGSRRHRPQQEDTGRQAAAARPLCKHPAPGTEQGPGPFLRAARKAARSLATRSEPLMPELWWAAQRSWARLGTRRSPEPGDCAAASPPGMQGRRLPARPSPSPAAGTFCSCPSALSSPHRHTPAIPMPQGAWRMARALFQRAKIRESIEQGEGRRRGNGLHTGVCGAAWGCQHETSQTAAIWRKQRSCWIHLRRAGYQVLPSSCLSPALLSSSTATAGETKPRHQTGMGQVTHLPFQSKAPLQGTVRSQLWCQDTSHSPVAAKLCCPSAPLLPTAPAEPSLAWGWSNTGPGVAEGPRVQYRTVCPACSQCRHKHSSSIPHSCGVQTLKT